MWHLTSIPKTAHFYWGGGPLSYLRYLTLKSFRRVNPDWHMILHRPQVTSEVGPTWKGHEQKNIYQGPDHAEQTSCLDIEICSHDFRDLGFNNHVHEVHKADFLRWHLLSTAGGLWSDMDILYVNPMDNLLENRGGNRHLDVGLVPLHDNSKHTVGFMLGSTNNQFFQTMLNQCRTDFDQGLYQSIGSDLLNRFDGLQQFKDEFPDNQIFFLDKKCVYSIASKRIYQFYEPVSESGPRRQTRHIGYHWFAGHPVSNAFESSLTAENINETNNILCWYIKELQL